MGATAVSLVINDDLTSEQMKTVLTNPGINILVSVMKVSEDEGEAVQAHFHVQAEVADPEMLVGILKTVIGAVESGKQAYEGRAPRGQADQVIKDKIASYETSKES